MNQTDIELSLLNSRPIYTARNFRHGSDKNRTGTKKCSTARVKFYSVIDFAGPKFHPCYDLPKTGSLSIGTGVGNTSPTRIKCVV